jgi:arylsulfatase A-like enzyme
VVILADDLGYGDLGCFGQKILTTPNLDKMAKEGMRLTQFYAGGASGTPSRCVMLTGRHGGRVAIRGGTPTPPGIPSEQPTVASLLKKEGYVTACIGQWGLGPADKPTAPNDAGFDHFFGALNLPHANNPYPEFLIRNGKVVPLKNEAAPEWKKWQDPKLPQGGKGVAAKKVEYAPELLIEDALGFVRENEKKPFFLYLALTLPHANQAGGENGLDGPGLEDFAARDWPRSEKAFAAQVRTLDKHVGRVLDLLKERGLDKHTLVLFTSDNGPSNECGHKADFFRSTGTMRGIKGELFEGSIRMPAIAWWPGTIAAGTENNLQWYVGDIPATAAELAGAALPTGLDSDSLLATLKGREETDRWKRKSPLYWETYEGNTAQAVRFGKWKALRVPMGTGEIELYDMSNDTGEKRDYSKRRPDLTKHAINLLEKHHQADPNRVPGK